MAKILDVESPLESRCEESSEWRHKRGKSRHEYQVEVVRHVGDAFDSDTQLMIGQPGNLDVGTKLTQVYKKLATGAQICHSFQMKVGFGRHATLLQALTPRS